jgi:hypothetical protein
MSDSSIELIEWNRVYDKGRYKTYEYQIDKAAKLEQFVQELTNETNNLLEKASIKEVSLNFRDFSISGKNYFNGYVGMYIGFSVKEPTFLTSDECSEFWLRLKELAKRKFEANEFRLDYYSINFEEDSEEELYLLTAKKEQVLKEGFENLENYMNWYVNSIESYKEVLDSHNKEFNKFIKNLE